jgi:hypothetical protein
MATAAEPAALQHPALKGKVLSRAMEPRSGGEAHGDSG